jgi:hypothetical protein
MNLIQRIFGRRIPKGRFVGRCRVHDDAITFHMRAGFAGTVTRSHPVAIEPVLNSVNAPTRLIGDAVIIDASDTNKGLRSLVAGDSGLTAVYGIVVRPFPTQSPTTPQNFGGTGALGAAQTPQPGAMDVCRMGYILVQVNVGETTPVKGGIVYVRVAATSGNHVQGNYETTASGGNNIALTSAGSIATYQGGVDANNMAEIAFNI